MHISFCWTNQKNLLPKGIKDWTFEVYLLTGELSSWFQLIESLKMTCARPYAWFLIFLSSTGSFHCFSQPNILPKFSKITVTCPKSLKWTSRVNFELPKIAEWLSTLNCSMSANYQFENLYISSYGETRNIKFGHQVNPIQRIQLSPLPREVVTTLLIIMWLWQISLSLVAEGLLLLNMGSKNNSLIEVHRVFLHWVSNIVTFWSCDINKSLSPIILRPQGLHSFMQMLKPSWTSCFKFFVTIKFSKFCKKDKCSQGSWPPFRILYLYMNKAN